MRKQIKQILPKHEIYKRNFYKVLQLINSRQFNNHLEISIAFKQAVFYGVHTIITYPKDEYLGLEDLKCRFTEIEHVKALIKNLTPIELMQVFPVEKYYKGHKFQSKDYFFTIHRINKLDMKKTFYRQKADINKVLWDYQNFAITNFLIEITYIIDGFRRLQGRESMMIEFMRTQGVRPMTMYTDETTGKKFLLDESGKTIPVKEKKDTGLLRVVR